MKYSLSTAIALAACAVLAGPAQSAIAVTQDPILYWNDVAIGLIGGGAPVQARAIAMLNIAMHDAVNSTYGGANNYYFTGVAAPGGNTRAAASVAARNVLVSLNPANTAAYDAALASSLALVSGGAAKTNGMTTGAAYASATILARTGDGSVAPPGFTYTPGTGAGKWRPTPPMNAPAALPHWGGVTPFLMDSGSQFRPGPPPALDSDAYTAAYDEVKAIGAAESATRTNDQRLSALFWDTSNGLTWTRIGVDLIADDGLSTIDNARIMAKLSTAVADSLIAGFDSKYVYNLWRPVTAIREGDNDENMATEGDAGWNSLFAAPAHPSYLSTHSLQSGAAAAVLLSLVEDQAFDNTIGPDTRSFTGIAQAAQDAADSRLWGGIHFRFDNEIGLATGGAIGEWTLARDAFNAVPEPANWAMMIAGFGIVGATTRRRVRARVAFG